MSETVETVQSDSKPKVQRCETCKTFCVGDEAYEKHLQSQKHKDKLEGKTTDDSSKKDSSLNKKDEKTSSRQSSKDRSDLKKKEGSDRDRRVRSRDRNRYGRQPGRRRGGDNSRDGFGRSYHSRSPRGMNRSRDKTSRKPYSGDAHKKKRHSSDSEGEVMYLSGSDWEIMDETNDDDESQPLEESTKKDNTEETKADSSENLEEKNDVGLSSVEDSTKIGDRPSKKVNQSPTDTKSEIQDENPNETTEKKVLKCEDCKTRFANIKKMDEHLKGDKHKVTMKFKAMKGTQVAKIQSQVERTSDPLLGLSLVLEVWRPLSEPLYRCILCNLECAGKTVMSHLIGNKHFNAYIQAFHPSLVSKMPPKKKIGNEAFEEFLLKSGINLIKEKIVVATEKEASDITSKICKSNNLPIPSFNKSPGKDQTSINDSSSGKAIIKKESSQSRPSANDVNSRKRKQELVRNSSKSFQERFSSRQNRLSPARKKPEPTIQSIKNTGSKSSIGKIQQVSKGKSNEKTVTKTSVLARSRLNRHREDIFRRRSLSVRRRFSPNPRHSKLSEENLGNLRQSLNHSINSDFQMSFNRTQENFNNSHDDYRRIQDVPYREIQLPYREDISLPHYNFSCQDEAMIDVERRESFIPCLAGPSEIENVPDRYLRNADYPYGDRIFYEGNMNISETNNHIYPDEMSSRADISHLPESLLPRYGDRDSMRDVLSTNGICHISDHMSKLDEADDFFRQRTISPQRGILFSSDRSPQRNYLARSGSLQRDDLHLRGRLPRSDLDQRGRSGQRDDLYLTSPQRNYLRPRGQSLQRDDLRPRGRSPQRDDLRPRGRSPQRDDLRPRGRSPQRIDLFVKGRSPQRDGLYPRGRSPQRDDLRPRGRSPQRNDLHPRSRSSQRDNLRRRGRSPQRNDLHPRSRSPQRVDLHPKVRSPQRDDLHLRDRSPRRTTRQQGRSLERDRLHQRSNSLNKSDLFQNGKELQKNILHKERSPRRNDLPQRHRSPQRNDSQRSERSLQRAETSRRQISQNELQKNLPKKHSDVTQNTQQNSQKSDSKANADRSQKNVSIPQNRSSQRQKEKKDDSHSKGISREFKSSQKISDKSLQKNNSDISFTQTASSSKNIAMTISQPKESQENLNQIGNLNTKNLGENLNKSFPKDSANYLAAAVLLAQTLLGKKTDSLPKQVDISILNQRSTTSERSNVSSNIAHITAPSKNTLAQSILGGLPNLLALGQIASGISPSNIPRKSHQPEKLGKMDHKPKQFQAESHSPPPRKRDSHSTRHKDVTSRANERSSSSLSRIRRQRSSRHKIFAVSGANATPVGRSRSNISGIQMDRPSVFESTWVSPFQDYSFLSAGSYSRYRRFVPDKPLNFFAGFGESSGQTSTTNSSVDRRFRSSDTRTRNRT